MVGQEKLVGHVLIALLVWVAVSIMMGRIVRSVITEADLIAFVVGFLTLHTQSDHHRLSGQGGHL